MDGSNRDVGLDAVAQVDDEAGIVGKRGEKLLGGAADGGERLVEEVGVEVALDGHGDLGADGGEGLVVVEADGGGLEGDELGEAGGGVTHEEDDGDIDGSDEAAEVGKAILGELGRSELVGPGIEDLDGVDAGSLLHFEVFDGDLSDGFEEGEVVMDVAGDGVGAAAEADEGDFELGFDEVDGVDNRLEGGEVCGVERASDAGAFGKVKGEAEGKGDDGDVGKEDGGVDAELVDGHEGDFSGEIRSEKEVAQWVLGAEGTVGGKVAARLAHEPDGRARGVLKLKRVEEH